jgi:hypothetical protein
MVALKGFGKLIKLNNIIGPRTRDLPACSIVPQPRMPQTKKRAITTSN